MVLLKNVKICSPSIVHWCQWLILYICYAQCVELDKNWFFCAAADLGYGPWTTFFPDAGVLDEPDSAEPAQRSSHTGPPDYKRWTQFQPMQTGGPIRLLSWAGLADYKARLKLPPLYDMTGRYQMQGNKKLDFAKEITAIRFFWDSHWLEIWKNHLCPSLGPNGGSVAIMDSEAVRHEREISNAGR